jgi:hypothetical protein
MTINTQELKILRSSFLKICFGVKIENFEEIFSYSKNKCNIILIGIGVKILIEHIG